MRPRVLASVILLIFLIAPVVLYWYFYEQKITALIFQSDNNTPYTVSLQGSLEYKYFPLLDKIFSYESICTGSCIFSPIPPLKYSITLSGSGKESVFDTVILAPWDSHKYRVSLKPTLHTEKMTLLSPEKNDEWKDYLWLDQEGNSVFLRMDSTSQKIWVYLWWRVSPLVTTSLPILSGKIDASRTYAILRGSTDEQHIYSLEDKRESIVFPYPEEIDIVTYSTYWKVRTKSTLYEYIWGNWIENIRFTDFIDISPRYRIGYIDTSDTRKLSLQNLPLDNSLFLLLDRKSTEVSIIKKWYNIRGFIFYKWLPSIIDTTGDISNISVALDK